MTNLPSDVAQKIAAIRSQLGMPPLGGGGGASGEPAPDQAAATADTDAPKAAEEPAAADDMQARIAALKAKMAAGKGPAAPSAPAAAEKAPAQAPPKAPKKASPSKPARSNVYPIEPINKTGFGDERLYRDRTVTRWFTVSSILLLITVVLMWRRDHVRDWKAIQSAHREREIQRLSAAIDEADARLDEETLEGIDTRLDEIRAELASGAEELDELQERQAELEGDFYAKNQIFQTRKSELDEMRYDFEELRLLHGDDAELLEESEAELEEKQEEVAAARLAADEANLALSEVKNRIKTVRAAEIDLERERDSLTEDRDRLASSLAKIDHSLFNDVIRNAPMADMLAPSLQIQKVVLDGLEDNYNFMYVDKVDMCMTCHVGIADPNYAGWDPDNSRREHIPGESVLAAHPRLDLFVSDSSPHPMGEFGCTVCHLGRGQAVEFERTFHTPTADAFESREEKEARWIRDWGYDPERHYWDWPMTPTDKLYSSCFMCHSSTDRIPFVPEYNESRVLVEELGCYGCHKIQGMEHLRKQGPDLTYVASKTDRSWASKWLMDPQGFRPTTRMPHFWNQSNSGGRGDELSLQADRTWHNNSDNYVEDWRARNDVEARAVLAYVWNKSEQALGLGGFPMEPVPAIAGDPEQGREIFEKRGCLGCHSVEAEGWTENDHGPDLSAVGSKVDPRWLYNWILEPKAYFPTTVMPDLRLTDEEAWHVTTWLMTLVDPAWESRAEPRADREILDSIAIEYLAGVAGEGWARERLDDMRGEGGDGAVELYVGEKLFGRYGCSGCHLVPDHYDDVGIGTELTYEALKEITKFDFGHEANHALPPGEAIEHNLHSWFRRKMQDPRVFDRLPVVVENEDGEEVVSHYDQKVKLPGEKLKMPNFYLTEHQVELLVQFLLGLRDDGIDPTMKHTLGPTEALVEEGNRLITKYNCTGCHRMGQLPQRLTVDVSGEELDDRLDALEEVIDESTEYGVWMAEPLVAGDVTLFHEGDWLSDEFYFPEWEEDADIYEFFEEFEDTAPIPETMWVWGEGEGAMGTYIDDAALRPPVLRREGEKVNPDWLFDFLVDPYIVRTHVEVRMPTFGLTEDESLALVHWFVAKDGEPWPFEVDADAEPDPELLAEGARLFADYSCNSCHPSGDVLPSNPDKLNWGPDLSMTSARLKPEWVREWLLAPATIQPGTKMPAFLGEPSDGEYSPYVDDPLGAARALQHYLKHLPMLQAQGAVRGN